MTDIEVTGIEFDSSSNFFLQRLIATMSKKIATIGIFQM